MVGEKKERKENEKKTHIKRGKKEWALNISFICRSVRNKWKI